MPVDPLPPGVERALMAIHKIVRTRFSEPERSAWFAAINQAMNTGDMATFKAWMANQSKRR